MKKVIQIMVLAITGIATNAQPAKDLKMKTLDKTSPMQTTDKKPVFTIVASSSLYTAAPRKVITLSGGRTMTVDMVRNPSTGGSVATNKVTTQNLQTEKSNGWTTDVKKVYLTAESTSFMNASSNNSINIVPGAIYGYEDFIGGNYNEIFANRNPMRISTDNAIKPGSTGGIVVNSPSAYEILQGNGGNNLNVIKNSIVESPNSGSDMESRSYTANSIAELNLKVTAGGSYAGFTASGSYKLTQNNNRFYLTIDVIKPMFTIKAERPLNGFFSAVNSVQNKIYIQEVTYGTRILANFEILLKSREDIGHFESAYSGAFTANLGGDIIKKDSLHSETLNAYLIGVPVGASNLFHKEKLDEEIRTLISQCNFQTAKPISYKLADMDGNTIATRSATDEIIERNSVPDDLVYHLQEAFLTISTGNDGKEYPSKVAMELYSGNGNNGTLLMSQPIDNSKNEFVASQPMTFGLSFSPGVRPAQLELNSIKNAGGLRVRIYYYANIFSDAWKIEDVSLKLKFVDQNNIPYSGTIGHMRLDGNGTGMSFDNSSGILDGFHRKVMECYLNSDFSSLSSTVKE